MTGEQLFLRYAFPCADGRLLRGKLDEVHSNKLTGFIERNSQPPRSLFRFCFPYAFRRLCKYARENGKERWALATVQEFWRYHHGHHGECRVRRGRILDLQTNGTMTAARIIVPETLESPEEELIVLNSYRLPVQEGQHVYFHFRVIAEINGVEIVRAPLLF